MSEQAILELIRTLGETYRVLNQTNQSILVELEKIKDNKASKEDTKQLAETLSQIYGHLYELTEAIETLNKPEIGTHAIVKDIKNKVDTVDTTINRWDKLWSFLFSAKAVGYYIIGVILAVLGFFAYFAK